MISELAADRTEIMEKAAIIAKRFALPFWKNID